MISPVSMGLVVSWKVWSCCLFEKRWVHFVCSAIEAGKLPQSECPEWQYCVHFHTITPSSITSYIHILPAAEMQEILVQQQRVTSLSKDAFFDAVNRARTAPTSSGRDQIQLANGDMSWFRILSAVDVDSHEESQYHDHVAPLPSAWQIDLESHWWRWYNRELQKIRWSIFITSSWFGIALLWQRWQRAAKSGDRKSVHNIMTTR